MKASEARQKSGAELRGEISELRREAFKLRMQGRSSGQAARPHRIREIRRTVARFETIIRERQLKAAPGSAATAAGAE